MSYRPNAELFAAALSENLLGVRYDAQKMTGSATIPNVGMIQFKEAANDPAVVINITFPKRFKGSAETALQFLEQLEAAWSNSD